MVEKRGDVMIRFLCLVGLGLALLVPGAARAADPARARAVVESALHDGIESFAGPTLPLEDRRVRLDSMLRRHSDPTLLSARILGRYWARFEPAEQATFSDLLIRFMVASYAGLLVDVPTGVTYVIDEPTDLGDRIRVPTTVSLPGPGAVPQPVDWEVAEVDGRAVIVDLTVEGVSLLKAMHEDFVSVLRASGGKAEPLFEAMRRKIAINEQSSPAR